MKKTLLALLCAAVLPAQAALITVGNDMVYDTATNLTWLRNAGLGGLKTQADAKAWAESLVIGGFDDWRLPEARPVNGSSLQLDFSDEGITDVGFNIRGMHSELGYLFHESLGNEAFGPLSNWGPFLNLGDETDPLGPVYWTGTESQPDWSLAFFMGMGDQEELFNDNLLSAWAVRVGAPAELPEPGALALAGLALAGMALRRRRQAGGASA